MNNYPVSTLSFNQKTVLITGAGRGIGYAIAKEFLDQEANIIVLDTDLDRWADYKDNPKVFTKIFNLFDHSSILKLIDGLWNVFSGGIHILINNAGINRDALLLKLDEKEWDEVLSLNLKTPFLLTQAIGKKMKFWTGQLCCIKSWSYSFH